MIKLKTAEEANKNKLEKTATFSLKDADRPLDEKEVEAENNAVKFSLKGYPRVAPIPGTLGFLLRNLRGGNASVMEFLEYSITGDNTNRTKWIKNFIILWNGMDEFSKRRVDIFDILCRKYEIPRKRFWGVLQEGMFDFNDQLTQTALSGYKPEFIELLKKFAGDRRNHQDRALLAKATKLIDKDGPLIQVNDNSKTMTVNNTQVNNGIPSFSESIRRSESGIRQTTRIPTREVKQLEEGEQDYVDAVLIEVEKQEDEKFDKQFSKLSKGL